MPPATASVWSLTPDSPATASISGLRGSFVCGLQGEVLAEAPREEPIVLLCPVDLGRTEQVRRAWPFLRDRRIDAYEGLTRRYLDLGLSEGSTTGRTK